MRTERYKNLLPPERLATSECSVIGVGAIGRQVALQLAAMGVGALHLVDFDRVEEANLGPQAYLAEDVGRSKVVATADLVARLNPDLRIDATAERYARSMEVRPVLFCCVDSIQTRRLVFEGAAARTRLFVDGRMAAEVLRVLSAFDGPSRSRYASTLFDPAQAHREGCTARSTIYCANVAAGLMVGQFARWLRGIDPELDLGLNLLSGELAVA